MGLSAGARIGVYEILGPLGAGGMGEVYRARDPRLGREVAIKVLPREWAGNPERLRRFEQEGRAASALAHPNLLTVHELGTFDGAPYLVTELLDGETLRERLRGGPLSARKAVEIAAQIARGLAAAHERGIVHRDLKPENLFLSAEGQVKILDFGIARMIGEDGGASGSGSAPLAPTLDLGPGAGDATTPLPAGATPATVSRTLPGAVLGTLGYMAPEQVRGRPAGPAVDIFALGAVLYEMLAGRPAFARATPADTVAAVLTEDPPELDSRQRPIPPAIALVLRRCLEKRPEERFRSARDLAFALDSLSTVTGSRSPSFARWRAAGDRRSARRAALVALALAGAAGLFWLGVRAGRASGGRAAPALGDFRQLTDAPGIEGFPSLSPDGTTVAFDSPIAGDSDIFVQRVGGRNAVNLTGGADLDRGHQDDRMPAFSPDGTRIAFRSDRDSGGLFVMGATGESMRRLTDFGYHPAWTPDGQQIVFSTGAVPGPQTVPASDLWVADVTTGSTRRVLSGARAVQPCVSPNGRRIAYWAAVGGQRDISTIAFGGAGESAEPVPVTQDAAVDWSPSWSADGRWLYFVSDRGGAMHPWRVRIDEATGRPLGAPQPLPVAAAASGPLAVAADGRHVVYRSWIDKFDLERLPFDPERGVPTGPPQVVLRSTWLANPDVSPDGLWLVMNSWRSPVDLWLVAADGRELRQLTADNERDARPVFSPDGTRIAFHRSRGDRYEIWSVRPDGSGLGVLAATADDGLYFPRWSRDGRRLAAYGDLRFHLVDAAVAPPRAEPLAVTGLAAGEVFVPWHWSADGATVAGFVVGPGDDVDDRGIAIYRFDTSAVERLTARGSSPWFLPGDRRLLYLERFGSGQVRQLDLVSGADEVAVSADVEASFVALAPAPDFRALYLMRTLGEGDLWIASLPGSD